MPGTSEGWRRGAGVLRDRSKVALTRSPALYRLARRPYALARYALRRPHDPDYGAFGLFPNRRGLFLDVGANAGMSALSFRVFRREDPILSIEPNPFHRDDLVFTGRLARRFRFIISAAGAEPGTLVLHVPVYRGTPLTTEASLRREDVEQSPSLRQRLGDGMDGPDLVIAERAVPVLRLDDLALAPAFVKLDVQGFEHEVLQGLVRTIETHRPVLLIETPPPRVRRWLAERGYEAHRFDPSTKRLVDDLEGALNLVFVPARA